MTFNISSILLIVSVLLVELEVRKGMRVGASLLKISGILSIVSWANVLAVSWREKKSSRDTLACRHNPQTDSRGKTVD